MYEKLKLSQSNLAKGEIFYRERMADLKGLQIQLINLRKELQSTQEQISCIDALRTEQNALEKDLLRQKNRVKTLADELQIKMNVHRWRKLEATDQENYERILKIQTLQRRLIAKNEEVTEKDLLIKEKEKLFLELKTILSRQPGNEIYNQLEIYKQNIKEKSGQMKQMLFELEQVQDKVCFLYRSTC